LVLDEVGARTLLEEAVQTALNIGLPWQSSGITLEPKPELVELVKRSRALSQQSVSEG
jgi:hypothetical protein